MKNYFGVTQRHIGTRAVYNYIAVRINHNGIKNNRRIMKGFVHKRKSMIKNTKSLNNHNWGKVAIGVHTRNVFL